MTPSSEATASKKQWRSELAGRRATSGSETRAAEATQLRKWLLGHVAETGASTVCAYVPVNSEPGSMDLLDGLREQGCRVLLPIVMGAQPLEWAEYTGPDSLHGARYGLLEPAGERLGEAAISEADFVLVPALAVDRHGTRLGRGAGHYDRSLPLAQASARLIAVIGDHEFVDDLPGESHDVRMNAVLTPQRGVVALAV